MQGIPLEISVPQVGLDDHALRAVLGVIVHRKQVTQKLVAADHTVHYRLPLAYVARLEQLQLIARVGEDVLVPTTQGINQYLEASEKAHKGPVIEILGKGTPSPQS